MIPGRRKTPVSRQRRRPLLAYRLTVTGVASVVALFPAAAGAHDDGGLFLPRVADFVVEGTASKAGRAIWVRIVDADSAQPAEGMRVSLVTRAGTADLDEIALGYYSTETLIGPGEERLTIAVQAGPGGPLTRAFRRSWTATVPPIEERKAIAGKGNAAGLHAAQRSPSHGARVAAAERGQHLTIKVEAVDDQGLASPLYVRVHAHIQRRDTGELDPTTYEMYGWAVDPSGTVTEYARLKPLDAIDPAFAAGTYGGVVILPSGGSWTVHAVALEFRNEAADPPFPVTEGALPVVREGPALQRAQAAVDDLAKPRANLFNTMILAAHSLSAATWTLILVLLLAMTYSGGRLLSGSARNVAEQNLDRLAQAAWITTGMVVWTGIYNLYKESPYRTIPNSWASLQDTLQLPFAVPYLAALAVKLVAYGVLLSCSVRLIRRAKALQGATSARHRRPMERNPWPRRPPEGEHAAPMAAEPVAPARAGPATAVLPARAALSSVNGDMDGDPEAAGLRSTTSLTIISTMAVCGVAIIACVTMLKVAHLLAEVTRVSS